MVIEGAPQRRAQPLPQRDAFSLATARLAEQRPLRSSILRRIASSLDNNCLEDAEKELGSYLAEHPDDPDALRLAARLENRLGRPAKAALLIERCLEFAPDFVAARLDYASTLRWSHEFAAALKEIERLLKNDADNPLFLKLKAEILAVVGEVEEARAIWQQLTTQSPTRGESWRKYGDMLRALGHLEDAVAAYRKAVGCRPSFGLAWSGLASLQGFHFSEADIRAMQVQVRHPAIPTEDRINFLFALGKAYEDLRDYERSWDHYVRANEAKRLQRSQSILSTSAGAEQRAVFTPAFLHRLSGGSPAHDPIFIVGRPRSGTTLVEQMLSSHSAVEGTGELPYIAGLASRLGNRETSKYGMGYAHALEKLTLPETRALGEEYLRKARLHRKTGRPFFVDKNPGNYYHVGLIRTILPHARIVDVRRNPAANCLSVFKLNYRGGLNPGLADLGRDYRDYVELVDHFDRALPGWMHRVIYENLVADPEIEIRRLLDYLGLPFEESCLHFYETERAVRTPSSEQVRRPISGESIEHWRNFEPWLAPLLASLGTVLTEYPSVPEELRRADRTDSVARKL